MVLLAFVPSLGNAEMPFQWAVVCLLGRLAEQCLCVWRCCCPTPLLLPWFVFPRAEGKGWGWRLQENLFCDSGILVQLCLWQHCYLSSGKVLSPQNLSAFWLGAWNIAINHSEIKKGTYSNSVLMINMSRGKLMKSLLQLDFCLWLDGLSRMIQKKIHFIP